MSDNDVLGGPPSNSFDSPQKIVKKIIYSPTSASDMRYDSLAHIDFLMGGRRPDEDLLDLTNQNEYSYVSPDSPEYPGMRESLVIRARIFDAMQHYKTNQKKKDAKKDDVHDVVPDLGQNSKLDFIKQVPEKITNKVKEKLLEFSQKLNKANPIEGLKKSLASLQEFRKKAQDEAKNKLSKVKSSLKKIKLTKEEKTAKQLWETKFGIQTDIRTWRTTKSYKLWRTKQIKKYADQGKDWYKENETALKKEKDKRLQEQKQAKIDAMSPNQKAEQSADVQNPTATSKEEPNKKSDDGGFITLEDTGIAQQIKGAKDNVFLSRLFPSKPKQPAPPQSFLGGSWSVTSTPNTSPSDYRFEINKVTETTIYDVSSSGDVKEIPLNAPQGWTLLLQQKNAEGEWVDGEINIASNKKTHRIIEVLDITAPQKVSFIIEAKAAEFAQPATPGPGMSSTGLPLTPESLAATPNTTGKAVAGEMTSSILYLVHDELYNEEWTTWFEEFHDLINIQQLIHANMDIYSNTVEIKNNTITLDKNKYHQSMVEYLTRTFPTVDTEEESTNASPVAIEYVSSSIEKINFEFTGEAKAEQPDDVTRQRPPIGTDHSYYNGQDNGAGKVKDPTNRGALIFGRADLDKALNDGYNMEEVYKWLKDNCLREWQPNTKDFTNMKGPGMTKLFPNTEDPSKHQELSEDELRANDGDNQAREKMPPGTWKVTAIIRQASFNQRFLVHSAKSGNGAYVNKGATAMVVAEKDWYLNIQSDKGSNLKTWTNSKLRPSKKSDTHYQLNSEDWTDGDFEDFVLSIEKVNGAAQPDVAAPPSSQQYVVKKGDSLSKIAGNLLGSQKEWKKLYEANKSTIGDNPNLIQIGMSLTIPGTAPQVEQPTSRPANLDEWYYRACNLDVDDAIKKGDFTDSWHHFQLYGYKENRTIEDTGQKTILDSKGYLAYYKDVGDAVKQGQFVSAAHHYVLFGRAEGRKANGFPEGVLLEPPTSRPANLDEWYYRACNLDVDDAIKKGDFTDTWHHFQLFGYMENRIIEDTGQTTVFDSKGYLREYQDVAEAVMMGQFVSAAHHYVLFGRAEGRMRTGFAEFTLPEQPVLPPPPSFVDTTKDLNLTIESDVSYFVEAHSDTEEWVTWFEEVHELGNFSTLYTVIDGINNRSVPLPEKENKVEPSTYVEHLYSFLFLSVQPEDVLVALDGVNIQSIVVTDTKKEEETGQPVAPGQPGAPVEAEKPVPPPASSGTKLYPAPYKAYHAFLNTHGVWGKDQYSAGIDASLPVYLPETGKYSVEATCDNIGEYFLNGKSLLKTTDWTQISSASFDGTKGGHTIRLKGENTGGPASLAIVIKSPSGEICFTSNDAQKWAPKPDQIANQPTPPKSSGPVEKPTSRPANLDEWYYRACNLDVDDAIKKGDFTDTWHHFQSFGFGENRIIEDTGNKSVFDSKGYLAVYQDVGDAVKKGQFVSAAHHYVLFGRAEGRKAKGFPEGDLPERPTSRPANLDEWYYRACNLDVDDAIKKGDFTDSWHHFQVFGYMEKRIIQDTGETTVFDSKGYLREYQDVAEAVMKGQFVSAAHHYVLFGRGEGRMRTGFAELTLPEQPVLPLLLLL